MENLIKVEERIVRERKLHNFENEVRKEIVKMGFSEHGMFDSDKLGVVAKVEFSTQIKCMFDFKDSDGRYTAVKNGWYRVEILYPEDWRNTLKEFFDRVEKKMAEQCYYRLCENVGVEF